MASRRKTPSPRTRCARPLHPLDQFRAFKNLHEQGLSIDDIAARFFVGVQVVRQRLKLAAASPKLLDLYVAVELSLDQLMAFCVTDDHAAYIVSWLQILKYDKRAIFTATSHAQTAADYLHSLQPQAATGDAMQEAA